MQAELNKSWDDLEKVKELASELDLSCSMTVLV